MTITNFSELIDKIVELLQENDREKPQNSVKIMMYVNEENGKAYPFMTDTDHYEYANHALFLGTRPAHYDDTWLSDMYDGLEISDIAEALGVDEQSLRFASAYKYYRGEAEPEEITVHDVEKYVYHNTALWKKVRELYEDFQNDNTDCYRDAALEMWNSFVYDYNYHATRAGKDVLQWEG